MSCTCVCTHKWACMRVQGSECRFGVQELGFRLVYGSGFWVKFRLQAVRYMVRVSGSGLDGRAEHYEPKELPSCSSARSCVWPESRISERTAPSSVCPEHSNRTCGDLNRLEGVAPAGSSNLIRRGHSGSEDGDDDAQERKPHAAAGVRPEWCSADDHSSAGL